MLCSEMHEHAFRYRGGLMLNFMRKQSPIMIHVIFWPIIAVFVIWGFQRYGGAAGGSAAVVDDKTISISQYRTALQRNIEYYSRMMGGNFDEKMQQQFRVKEQAMNQLIGSILVSEEAQKMGLQVTDAEVRDQILALPFLQQNGRFSKERYDEILKGQHMSPAQFETDIREEILRSKIDKLFETELVPSEMAIEKDKQLREVKMNVGLLTIDKPGLIEKRKVSESQIAT